MSETGQTPRHRNQSSQALRTALNQGRSVPLTHESCTQLDRMLRHTLRTEWGIEQALHPLAQGSTALTWQVPTKFGPAVVKLSWDSPGHFLAGLVASQAVEAAGIAAGVPLASRSGALSADIEDGQHAWPVAVLRQIDGTPASLKTMNVRGLGALLARLHVSLSSCEAAEAWTVTDVVGHMRRGILAAHPPWARQVVRSATHAVEVVYATPQLRQQVIRGDGPEILLTPDGTISGMIDWGGIRLGSVSDDIGCWTLYLGMLHRAYHETREEFLRGYTSVASLMPEERAAVSVFQRLRLASRLCYVTDRDALAFVQRWLLAWQADQEGEGQ
jgi:Ser/Thr protein kinase RdoA (MazF antagonist)